MDFVGAFFDTNDFKLIPNSKLGQGAFGTVYVVESIDNKKYAAKMIDPQGMLDGNEQLKFLIESQILKKLNHPAIVKFYGINFHSFTDSSKLEPTILTEYIVNGSLQKVLDAERKHNCDKNWNDTKKYICLLGIAEAMRYLHSNGILHRDLKPLNVLLDENFYPKICDFGLSRCFSENLSNTIQIAMTGFAGSSIYMAPEIIEGNKYGCAIDVFSFAIIAYTVVTGISPFSHLKPFPNLYQLNTKILDGERPVFPEKVNEKMKKLIVRCWSPNPEERPSFAEIFHTLSTDFSYTDAEINEKEVIEYIMMVSRSKSSTKLSPKLSNLFFDTSSLEKQGCLGRGGTGSFYKAVLPATNERGETEYTLKILNPLKSQQDQRRFFKSIEIQSSLKHESVLPLVGFSLPTDGDKSYSIVTPFMKNGSVDEMIKNVANGKIPDGWETIKAMTIIGIAAGMAYIHQHDILLANLRTDTVFYDENFHPKISSFSVAFNLKSGRKLSDVELNGIPLYMAPESIQCEDISNKVDVYSFSIALYSILTLKLPFDDLKNIGGFKLMDLVSKGRRPLINEGEIGDYFLKLLESCWDQNPDNRPTFNDIVQKLISEKDKFFDMDSVDAKVLDDYIAQVTKNLYLS